MSQTPECEPIQIIVASASVYKDDRFKNFLVACHTFLPKSINLNLLLEKLQELLKLK